MESCSTCKSPWSQPLMYRMMSAKGPLAGALDPAPSKAMRARTPSYPCAGQGLHLPIAARSHQKEERQARSGSQATPVLAWNAVHQIGEMGATSPKNGRKGPHRGSRAIAAGLPQRKETSVASAPKHKPSMDGQCPCLKDEDKQMLSLACFLDNPQFVVASARQLLRRYDTDGDGELSFVEVESVVAEFDRQLGCTASEALQRYRTLPLKVSKWFDAKGDGKIGIDELAEFLKWSLWCKYDELMPLSFKRNDLVGALRKGSYSRHYSILSKLGNGQFGVVDKVMHRYTGSLRVMKSIDKEKTLQAGVDWQKEIDSLAMLDHPHILRLYECYQDDRTVSMISDICLGGELLHIVEEQARKQARLAEPWLAQVFSQTLEAISYCHTKGLMHKDLKFENIMLHSKVTCDSPINDIHVVLIDVGLSELFGLQHGKPLRSNNLAGNLATMAPQVINKDFSCKCDIWSIGCLLYAAFNAVPKYLVDEATGTTTFYTYPFLPQPTVADPVGVKSLIASQKHGPPMQELQNASFEAHDIIKQMLNFDEQHRPSAVECLEMPWFKRALPQKCAKLCPRQVSKLQQNHSNGSHHWWRAMGALAATQLPASETAWLLELFKQVDAQKCGFVSCDELHLSLQQLGLPSGDAEHVAKNAAFDKSGRVEWSAFVAAMLPMNRQLFVNAVRTAFETIDANKDGYIDHDEICQLLSNRQLQLSQTPLNPHRTFATCTADMMLAEMDIDGIGIISSQDFNAYFLPADTLSQSGSSIE